MTAIDISTHRTADRHVLAYDPEADLIYSWYGHGSGMPERMWTGEHPRVLSFPADVVPESLARWVERNEEKILEVAEESLAARTAGHDEDDDDFDFASISAAERLEEEFRSAIDGGEVARYWDAREWLAGDPPDADDVSSDTWIDDELAQAARQGVFLDRDELEEARAEILAG